VSKRGVNSLCEHLTFDKSDIALQSIVPSASDMHSSPSHLLVCVCSGGGGGGGGGGGATVVGMSTCLDVDGVILSKKKAIFTEDVNHALHRVHNLIKSAHVSSSCRFRK
jgi:hypothetical protein